MSIQRTKYLSFLWAVREINCLPWSTTTCCESVETCAWDKCSFNGSKWLGMYERNLSFSPWGGLLFCCGEQEDGTDWHKETWPNTWTTYLVQGQIRETRQEMSQMRDEWIRNLNLHWICWLDLTKCFSALYIFKQMRVFKSTVKAALYIWNQWQTSCPDQTPPPSVVHPSVNWFLF